MLLILMNMSLDNRKSVDLVSKVNTPFSKNSPLLRGKYRH